jgi:uncharacterized membrane protein
MASIPIQSHLATLAGGMLGGGGMRMAPSVNLMPRTSFGFGGFGGFGGYPGYYGGGYGTPVVSSGGGGGGLFTLLALGVLGYAALQILPRLAGGNDDSGRLHCRQIPASNSTDFRKAALAICST